MLYQVIKYRHFAYPGCPSKSQNFVLQIEEEDTIIFKLLKNTKPYPVKLRPIKGNTQKASFGPITKENRQSESDNKPNRSNESALKLNEESNTENTKCTNMKEGTVSSTPSTTPNPEFMQSHENLNSDKGFFIQL